MCSVSLKKVGDKSVIHQEKVKVNKQLPYLVANVVEVLEPDAEDGMFLFVLIFAKLGIGLHARYRSWLQIVQL